MLYPPVEPSSSVKLARCKKPLPGEESKPEDGEKRLVLTIGEVLQWKIETEDDTITTFISDPYSISYSNQ